MGRVKIRALASVAVVAVAALAWTPANAAATCADPKADAGEWRTSGGTMANQRNQPNESVIGAGNVANVAKVFTFSTDGSGTLQNTPVIADGCMYLATSSGVVFAVNADTGEKVWQTTVPGSAAGALLGGVITGSPTVEYGRVYVAVSKLHDPFIAALDQGTGEILWQQPLLDDAKRPTPGQSYRNTTVSAPTVWNRSLFIGIMADENSPVPRGGYSIIDLNEDLGSDGKPLPKNRLLTQEWTIDDAEYAAGYRGASVWCTAAIDEETGYAYACGGNPASKQKEPRYSNALLKIDMNRGSDTFGEIVASYKGDNDQYYPGLDRQPACDQVPTTLVWSPTCAQLDLDFGSSPSLFKDEIGRTIVGDLQKSGIYHALYADHMQRLWTAVVGTPCFACNAASPAVDEKAAGEGRVFTAANLPGQMWGLSKDRGRARWVGPIGTGTHFQPVSTANGVVYTVNNTGELIAYDAATGLTLLRRPMTLDAGSYAGDTSSQGVAIARNTIYAASGGFVVAYR